MLTKENLKSEFIVCMTGAWYDKRAEHKQRKTAYFHS